MRLMNKAKKTKSGFSLVELLAVVGIGGALVAGALLLVSDVQSKRAIKAHNENISAIFNNMQNLFSDETIDAGITTEQLVTAGVFPQSLNINTAGDTVLTMGGGAVKITPAGNGYALDYPKVKASTCVEVIKGQRKVGWDTWVADASSVTTATAASTKFETTSIVGITTACKTSSDWINLSFFIE